MTPHPSLAPLRRARWIWLAVLLAVFGAVMPTVSHALAGGASAATMEVCTSTGMAWVDAHGPGDASGQEASAQPMDCAWCLLSAAPVFPVPQAVGALSVEPGALPAPAVQLPFFRLAFAALAPPPRGPPVVS